MEAHGAGDLVPCGSSSFPRPPHSWAPAPGLGCWISEPPGFHFLSPPHQGLENLRFLYVKLFPP